MLSIRLGCAFLSILATSIHALGPPLASQFSSQSRDGGGYFNGFPSLKTESYDSGLFSPYGSLSSLAETQYATLGHPLFPRYNVRIKKSKFCDETVNAYTGYIDIEARHLFFYFFESRENPDKDDVIFWTNGGPGCSSSVGLFFELGPCRVPTPNGTVFHPESWNTNANLFFIDQPVGVGFSYAEYGEYVSTTEEAAKDIAAFVAIFSRTFTSSKEERSTWQANLTGDDTYPSLRQRYMTKILGLSRRARHLLTLFLL